MNRVLAGILGASLLVLGACPKPNDAPTPGEPVGDPAPLYSYAQASDLRAAPQFAKGFFDIESGAWRWMGRQAVLMLRPPNELPAVFEVRLTFPPGHMAAHGPVTFAVLIDDRPFAEKSYGQDGSYVFEAPVPQGRLGSRQVKVTLQVDRVKPADPARDSRELGAVILGAGFR